MPRENERTPGQNQGPGSPADRGDNRARHPIREQDRPDAPAKTTPPAGAPKKGRPPSPTEDVAVNPGLASEDRQQLPADGTDAFGEESR